MKTQQRRLHLWLLALSALLICPLLGCGAGAPPASIPAPFSSLLSISPPDPTGAITISGAAGSVEPNANVQAQNISQAGPFTFLKKWKDWLIRSAYAQLIFFAEVPADNQGAFNNLRVDGASGDIIGVRQEVGGEFSPDTQLTVP